MPAKTVARKQKSNSQNKIKTSRKEWLRSEISLLSSLLDNRKTFRHHLWLRHCKLALHRCKRALGNGSLIAKALRCIQRAAAECVSELRQVRVDTVGLTTALLAVLARIHLLFSVDQSNAASALAEEYTLTNSMSRAKKGGTMSLQEALQVDEADALDGL